jgi:hypothetical protein
MPTLLLLLLPLPQLPTYEDLPELKKFEIHFLKLIYFSCLSLPLSESQKFGQY